MITLKFNKNNYTQEEIDKISEYFLDGKIIAYPTDTIYGLGCTIDNKKGVENIGKIKNRSKKKAYIVLVKSYCMLHHYFNVSKKQDEYLRKKWIANTRPGFEKNLKYSGKAYTFILDPKPNFPKYLLSNFHGVAVRLPKVEFLIKILKKVNKPIISTSLNISGDSIISNPLLTMDKFSILPDVLVDSGEIGYKPSSIFDIRDVENIKIIR